MKGKWLVMAVAAMVAGAAFAQGAAKSGVTPNINQGTKVLAGSGAVDADTPVGTQTSLDLGYGYFVIDGLEIGGVGGFQDNKFYTTYEIGALAVYNLDLDSPIVPFVGAGALYVAVDVDDVDDTPDTVVGRFTAGVKWFIRDDVALAVSAVYDVAADDIYFDEDGKAKDDNFKGIFGIRYYFD